MRELIREDVVMFEGHLMQTVELKGYRPVWLPRSVWVKAIQHLDLGATNVEFYGEDGQKWRARDTSVVRGAGASIGLHTRANPRESKNGSKKGAKYFA